MSDGSVVAYMSTSPLCLSLEAVAQLNLPQHKTYLAGPGPRGHLTHEEAWKALKGLATRFRVTPTKYLSPRRLLL